MEVKENPKPVPFLPLFFFFLLLTCCRAFNNGTITKSQYVRDGETIMSPGGSFILGFFSPGNSTKRYAGIWFGKTTIQTVVWVANRETPLIDASGYLKIGGDANLVVMDGQENVLWSSNSSLTSNTSVGVLLDSGNLILREQNSDKLDGVYWQSFEHPTDTFLPGMKFGINLRTGENQLLTAWKNVNDPAPGDFSLGFDPSGIIQIMVWNSSSKRWRSGPWNGQALTGVPGMSSFHLYEFNIIFDEHEGRMYATYSNMNSSVVSSFVLTSNGKLDRSYWNLMALGWDVVWSQPNSECQLYERCGPYGVCNRKGNPICSCLPGFSPLMPNDWRSGNWSAGCVRTIRLGCTASIHRSQDGFLKLTNMKLPDNSILVPAIETLQDCEKNCNSSCSCIAYTYESGLGCLTWEGDMNDIEAFPSDGKDLYICLNKLSLRDRKKQKLKLLFTIIMLALGLVLFYAIFMFIRTRTRQRQSQSERYSQQVHFSNLGSQNNSNRHYLDVHELEESVRKGKGSELPIFGLDMITVATDNFSLANKLGEGGFGPVFKGTLPTGQMIAVKRLSKGSGQGVLEFENEVILLVKLQHRNLVRLLGCCWQGLEKMLIYEYMPNKSLDTFLFDQTKKQELDWKTRFSIIEGVARGLLYLHRDSRLRIIHRDLKVSNILLDEGMNPKISDFGMARIFWGNQNEDNTIRVVGTYGYMAPEYAMEGLFSVKSDVFSFGVLLLEIVSGKRNAGSIHPDKPLNLVGHAWELWKEKKMLELMDPSLQNLYSEKEASRCLQVGLLCVQEIASDRPSMDAVVFMLGTQVAVLPVPRKPAFSTGRTPRESEIYACSSDMYCSGSDLTISMELGR